MRIEKRRRFAAARGFGRVVPLVDTKGRKEGRSALPRGVATEKAIKIMGAGAYLAEGEDLIARRIERVVSE